MAGSEDASPSGCSWRGGWLSGGPAKGAVGASKAGAAVIGAAATAPLRARSIRAAKPEAETIDALESDIFMHVTPKRRDNAWRTAWMRRDQTSTT